MHTPDSRHRVHRVGAVALIASLASSDLQGAPEGDTPLLDLMVVYTPLSVQQAGRDQILALIDEGVSILNMALTNSQVNLQVRLVHTQEFGFIETADIFDDLFALTFVDGVADDIHPLRDQYYADAVHLVRGELETVCGAGWKPLQPITAESMNRGQNVFMFSESVWSCTASSADMTLAQTVGFNLGCGSDYGSSNQGSYPFSFAHVVARLFSTIEALNLDKVNDPPRIPFFSNPDVFYQGVPAGVPAGLPGQANNALSLTLNTPGIIVARTRPGDVNQDGITNITDLLALLAAWSRNDPSADFDEDRTVGIGDLLILLAYWGY